MDSKCCEATKTEEGSAMRLFKNFLCGLYCFFMFYFIVVVGTMIDKIRECKTQPERGAK